MIFEQVLSLAKKYLFFYPVISKSGKNILNYEFGPSGALFLENIKTEWIYSNVTNRDSNVFLYNSIDRGNKLHEEHYKLANLINKQLPFGIAEIYSICKKDSKGGVLSDSSYFNSLTTTKVSSTMFLTPQDGMQYFFYWQRQRKLWWKKISAFPGRFFLSDVKSSSSEATVNIYAKFSWGEQILETISITPNNSDILESQKTSKKKDIVPSKICSEMSLENAIVGLFCDGLDDTSDPKNCVLRLHRKLTPHKCIFAAGCSDPATLEELAQLAFYLTKQFRKVGIQTMLLSDCTTIPLEDQFLRNDEWGIPYTIVLDDVSLKQGIIKLRSRDTTLTEDVHLSDLTTYITRLFKNF